MNFSEERLLRLGIRNDAIVSIDEVENGKLCGCVCAQCGAALIAKNQGKVKIHHFAHANDSDCRGSVESALHLMAKEILLETKKMYIPNFTHYFSDFNKTSILIEHSKCLEFDSVLLEEKINIDGEFIVADALCEINGKKIIIEFAKTHFIDDLKREKLTRLGIACLEFPISTGTQDRKTFTEELFSDTFKPLWIINKKAEQLIPAEYVRLKKAFDELTVRQKIAAENEIQRLFALEQIKVRKMQNRNKVNLKNKERELEAARKKGNLIYMCPIPKELANVYFAWLLGSDPIVKKLAVTKEISDIYYKTEFVDVFLDGEREILIPENYPNLPKVEQLEWQAKLNIVEKFLAYRKSKQTGFCHSCKFFHGIVYGFITCSYNQGQKIENSLRFN